MEFRLKKIYDAQINDSRTFDEAIKDFGLNYVKGSTRLKKDKNFALEAVKQYPWTIIHLPLELLEDEDIKEEIKKDNTYLFNKYIDPTDEFLRQSLANNIKVDIMEVRRQLEREDKLSDPYENYKDRVRGKEYVKER